MMSMPTLSVRTFRVLSAAALASLGFGACSIEGTTDAVDDRVPYAPDPAPDPYRPDLLAPAQQTRRVVILHTNDEHSHLLGFAPNSEYPFVTDDAGTVDAAAIIGALAVRAATPPDPTRRKNVGGLVRRQFEINELRAEAEAAGDPVLVLSAGDSTMGTVFHAAGSQAAPDYVGMALLGYDFTTLGNHEFDFGADFLADTIRAAGNMALGGAVPIIATNISFDDVTPPDPAAVPPVAASAGYDLQTLYGAGDSGAPIMPWATKLLANGLEVGFFGLMGYDAALVAPNASPVAFSEPPGDACTNAKTDCTPNSIERCIRSRCIDPLDANGHLAAIIADAQPVIDELRDVEQVDLVVALSHLGIAEDQVLAAGTTGLDVIIGGHSHDEVAPSPDTTSGVIIVQAGSYGRKLGQLTITVAPDGTVDYDPVGTLLHPIDEDIDLEIFAGTNTTTGKPSEALVRGLELTGALIGPAVGGLNQLLGAAFAGTPLAGTTVFSTVAVSDYDVIGEKPSQDHPLFHLVTDADLALIGGGACLAVPGNNIGRYTVAVQANGVIRESLRFRQEAAPNNTTTFADAFRVLPLGASPFESPALPGYPMVIFAIDGPSLIGALDIGVTTGLQADSFFLSYAGMRVTYDPSAPPFDKDNADTTGRVTKIEISDGAGGYLAPPIYSVAYDAGGVPTPASFPARFDSTMFNIASDKITIITNMYLAGFLGAFNIIPYNHQTGVAFPDIGLDGVNDLAQMILCNTGGQDCSGIPPLERCIVASTSGHIPWLNLTDATCSAQVDLAGCTGTAGCSWSTRGAGCGRPIAEAKEWAIMLSYLGLLGGSLPPGMYEDGAAFSSRVVAQ